MSFWEDLRAWAKGEWVHSKPSESKPKDTVYEQQIAAYLKPKLAHGMSCARCSKPVRKGDKFAVLQVAHKDCADPKMRGK